MPRPPPGPRLGHASMTPMSPVRRLAVTTATPHDPAIAEAARVLRAGGLVAFPTETVYGLGANALDAAAVRSIFAAKGRPASNPLIVHAADADSLRRLVGTWPPEAARLAEACWPGPLTLVLPRAQVLPPCVSAGLTAVGVRVPAHPVALALLQAAGVPVAAPSANPYMGLSPTTADHVAQGLAGARQEVLLLDGGAAAVGLESTVLDLTSQPPRILRPGGTSAAALRALLGRVDGLVPGAPQGGLPSPGLAARHYAPRATLRVVAGGEGLRQAALQLERAGARLAVLGLTPAPADHPAWRWVAMPGDALSYGQHLYAALHDLDAEGATDVLVEAPPAEEAWAAVADRLQRAASPR
ncbi:MAG: L-threonylcarbamoyladenylate synthase [Candidatus Sericytochromatia bacterium]|nr:L-threonylcarbamoyladenylate synthase [Candidatus Sericytochromatia bacterium]